MQKKVITVIATTALFSFFFAGAAWADIPAPPANQFLGLPDGIFNDLDEAECRACHDDPEVVEGPSNVDRHHLLYGEPIQEGACSVNKNACLSDADCDPTICEFGPSFSCTEDDQCPDFTLGETCGERCVGKSAAPDIDANNDGNSDTEYSCLSCHQESTAGGVISFVVERDCLQCHIQIPGDASVHHLTATAQGGDSPIGDPDVGDCTPCHGTLVDDIGDGHDIPTYPISSITPRPHGGTGPPNDYGNGAGACNFCHDQDTKPPLDPIEIYANNDTHHNTGVFRSSTGATNDSACNWCHPHGSITMRGCEGCHGYESLHNIQVDSNGDGVIEVGGELYGYGHIGIDDPSGDSDCQGCHGNAIATAASGAGPITPYIQTIDVNLMTAGTDTPITLTGSAFTNLSNDFQWISEVLLQAADGSSSTLTPDTITESSLTVTIPGTTTPGNYTLQAVKDISAASNPVPLSIKPEVVITQIDCSKCLGTMTITGSGFTVKPGGTDEDLYVIEGEGGRLLKVISWTETEIKVLDARCRGDVTVNALFGSATIDQ